MMLIDFEPGDYVINLKNKDWGVGQVQSIIGNKVTVNFENYGKRVINIENIRLEKYRSVKTGIHFLTFYYHQLACHGWHVKKMCRVKFSY